MSVLSHCPVHHLYVDLIYSKAYLNIVKIHLFKPIALRGLLNYFNIPFQRLY